jgi:hypothetical protein
VYDDFHKFGRWYTHGRGDYIEGMCLPQVIKSFPNYGGIATTFYPTLVDKIKKNRNFNGC